MIRELQPGEEWGSPGDKIEAEACRVGQSGTSPFDPDAWDGRGGYRCLEVGDEPEVKWEANHCISVESRVGVITNPRYPPAPTWHLKNSCPHVVSTVWCDAASDGDGCLRSSTRLDATWPEATPPPGETAESSLVWGRYLNLGIEGTNNVDILVGACYAVPNSTNTGLALEDDGTVAGCVGNAPHTPPAPVRGWHFD